MHVLMFAQVRGNLSHFRIELHICVPLLPKHDGILQAEQKAQERNQKTQKKQTTTNKMKKEIIPMLETMAFM